MTNGQMNKEPDADGLQRSGLILLTFPRGKQLKFQRL